MADRLLLGLLHRFSGEYGQAAVLLHAALAELQDKAVPEDLRLPWMRIGTFVATDLLDEQAKAALPLEEARLARRRGALTALPLAILAIADAYLREGRFGPAQDGIAEALEIAAATGNPGIYGKASLDVTVLCWRGRGKEARAAAADAIAGMHNRGLDTGANPVRGRMALLELGLGNYREALVHARYLYGADPLGWGTWILPELSEAAVRCNETGLAEGALHRLAARAQASGTPWALGLLVLLCINKATY